jgi:DNA-binding IclR family transcriptional regulator
MAKETARPRLKSAASSQPERGTSYAATLVRGLAVLRCFDDTNDDLGVSEIARMVGIPQPTVWRLCRTLEAEGYLVVDRSGKRFRPGLAVLGLGFSAINRIGLTEYARPALTDLAAEFHSVAGIAVPERLVMRYIQRQQAPDAMLSFNIRVGRTLPISTSSAGWAYLAALDEDRRNAVIRNLKKEQAELWKHGSGAFQSALAGFRDTGVIVNIDTFYPGLTSVSVPLISPTTQAFYAVYCTGLSSILTRKTVIGKLSPRLKAMAGELRLALASEESLG